MRCNRSGFCNRLIGHAGRHFGEWKKGVSITWEDIYTISEKEEDGEIVLEVRETALESN